MAKGEGVVKSEEESPDLDQYAKDALDELFSKEEQSYEEFLQDLFLTTIPKNGATCHEEKTTNDVGVQSSSSTKSQLTESDHIPEEVLGPGSTSVPILMRTAESSSGAVLQVDNLLSVKMN
ncbi:hypothetical protein OS493_011130 [Desmophyllum pertusum]|uniref:Uncharacterized protein n=1 Tax=Desmophyllum pertusum TaxID=174260 RepID=A0A9X0CS10_9CNID|nr:hypothetical protein OS493_011130 [Desmophyllum pertusum]